MFEIIALLLCGLAIAAVIMPLAKRQEPPEIASDVSFFQEQLRQIDHQISATPENIEALEEERVEVAKRLLKADRQADSDGFDQSFSRATKTGIALASIVALPLSAFALYIYVGSPGTPDAPLRTIAQKDLKQLPIQQLLTRAEAQLEANPNDLKGWQVVERVYARLQRKQDQKRALLQIIRIDGETADRLAGLAELQLEENDGVISTATRAMLSRALSLDSNHIRANFYMSYAEEQEGDFNKAAERIARLLPRAEPGSQLEPVIKDRLAQLQSKANGTDLGPTAEDVKTASQLSEQDRAEFIRGMVENLEQKTIEDPTVKANWPKLINAYIVLGEYEAAQNALNRAQLLFPEDDTMTAVLGRLANRLKQKKAVQQ